MDTSEGIGLDAGTAVTAALLATAVLVSLHLLAPRIRRMSLVPERVSGSFAGGLAVSYVFLHLLPELAEGNEHLRELFGETADRTSLTELGIFVVALAGFTLFYGLERLARSTAASDGRGTARTRVFWVHLGAFALYNGVIAYSLPLTFRTGTGFAVLFTIAMGLHFVLSDRGLEENYGDRFDHSPARLVLAGALLLGWILAALFAPTSSVTVSLLTAFIAGSVLLNVFKEEIPSGGRSSFGWFMVGLVTYALLLAGVTALSE